MSAKISSEEVKNDFNPYTGDSTKKFEAAMKKHHQELSVKARELAEKIDTKPRERPPMKDMRVRDLANVPKPRIIKQRTEPSESNNERNEEVRSSKTDSKLQPIKPARTRVR